LIETGGTHDSGASRPYRQKGVRMRQLYLLALAVLIALSLEMAAFGTAEAQADRNKPSMQERIRDLQQEMASLREDVEDLQEPVEEFDLFDQCMFTIGVTQYGSRDGTAGYVYGEGGQERRQALAMDMRGFDAPQYDFMAFPGEEPPQIECNEDAGGQDTDE
jgi:hypothetical protein